MAPVNEQLLRSLANFSSDRAPVTSLYLDVDGRRHVRSRDVGPHLEALARQAREQVANGAFGREAQASVEADLHRISEHVRFQLDRSRTRGLAVFSCSADGFWHVVELTSPMRDRVVVKPTPHLRELKAVLDHATRIAVLLADRQRARLFLIHQGELVEKTELDDPLPRHDDDGGDLTRDQVAGRTAAVALRHLRRVAHATFAAFRELGFDALVLGAPEEVAGLLERELHPYLRERIAARLSIDVGARDEDIRRAAIDVEAALEQAQEATLVSRLRDAVGVGVAGVAGLDATLGALVARRVATLLVSDGYEAPGWCCSSCGFVGVLGRSCPVCAAEMTLVADVVEAAVEEALGQPCRVVVCTNVDLDVLGRIGALLRY